VTPDEQIDDAQFLTRASFLERLQASDTTARERAWSEFCDRYRRVIGGFAVRCGAAKQDIEDIVQDVLAGFLSKQGEFVYDSSKGRFRGYLKTCTVRAAIRRMGKNARFRGIPLEDLPDADASVEPVWNDVWEQQLVLQAITTIRDQRPGDTTFQAFERYVLQNESAETVAEQLGIDVNSVYQAKTRITRELQRVLTSLRVLD
jgi:RNA polymerase sigma-70 factor, ECF subfamily